MGQSQKEGERVAFYLKKRAASEEAEQPVTLTGGSYTDLRRQDRWQRGRDRHKGIRQVEVKGNE